MRRWTRYAMSLVVVLCLACTACLSGQGKLKVKGDGSGQFEIEIFPPGVTRVPLRDLKIQQLLEDTFSGSSTAKVEMVKSDGLTGYHVVVPFSDTDDVVAKLNAPALVGSHPTRLFSQFSLTKEADADGDNWRLDAQLNSLDEIFAPLKDAPEFAAVKNVLEESTSHPSAALNFTVDLPGVIVNSNATKRSGGSATWEITSTTTPTVMRARTEPGPLLTTLQKGLVALGILIALGLVLVLVGKQLSHSNATRRLKRSERKAFKERAAAGWGPKGPNAMPGTPAPSTDIGRTLPKAGPQPQPEPGSYDPVKGIRVGHTPTADVPEPLIGVEEQPWVKPEPEPEVDLVPEPPKVAAPPEPAAQEPAPPEPAPVPAAPEPASPDPGTPESGDVAEQEPGEVTKHKVGPLSDQDVAAALADAMGGTNGAKRWASGPLTDREVAEAVIDAVSGWSEEEDE